MMGCKGTIHDDDDDDDGTTECEHDMLGDGQSIKLGHDCSYGCKEKGRTIAHSSRLQDIASHSI